ncbi:Zinc finger protein 358 [Stylophora pistillata]|uniref:Zinc finger protein 358 n=2 Tax=Stylophora pistillata TaxID=50429 RepID=A0A2B4SVF2_STYPI|nr:Zinc finger protein 358 [Stylophora pistillata]
MEKGYTGLRRTRKRAHSTKCSCCYSSEDEPENHASTRKEKSKECDPENGKRVSTRKKVKTEDVLSGSNGKDTGEGTINPDEFVGKKQKGNQNKKATASETSKKTVPTRRKTPTVQKSPESNPNGEDLELKKKQHSKGSNSTGKKKRKARSVISKNDKNQGENTDLNKRADSQTQSRDKKVKKKSLKDEVQNTPRNIDKIIAHGKEKSANNKQNATKEEMGPVVEGTLCSDLKRSSSKASETEHEKVINTRGTSKNVKSLNDSINETTREKDVPLGSRKRTNNLQNSGSLSEKKIGVFEHLFAELKKCPGLKKVTVSSAAELLLKLTADKLKTVVPSLSSKKVKSSVDKVNKSGEDVMLSPAKSKSSCSVSEPKRRRPNSEKSPLGSPVSSDKPTTGKSELVKLSQAAEALVSFRANPTILHQDNKEGDVSHGKAVEEVTSNTFPDSEKNSSFKEPSTVSNVVSASVQSVASSSEQGLLQVESNTHSQSQIVSQVQPGFVVHNPFPQQTVRFPANIEASLQQVAHVQQNLLNLSQVTSQLSPAAVVPPQLSPRLTGACPTNPSGSNVLGPRLLNSTAVQNIQGLFCRPVTPSSIQTSMTAQNPPPSLPPSSNNQRARPQQPLKGMENVVSCVGSRSTANLLWNIKPAAPVVYLTSPQTLSGVRARNLIPQTEGPTPSPFTSGLASVQALGIPKTSLNSTSTSMFTLGKTTVVSQVAPLVTPHSVSVSNQRLILPREQRAPSVFPGGLKSTPAQILPTTVMGQIPRSIAPVVLPRSVPLQSSSVGATTNRQPATSSMTSWSCATNVQTTTANSITTAVAPVSAKQAVKKFVHERNKSVELKRTGSLNNLQTNEPVAASKDVGIDKSKGVMMNTLLQCHGRQPSEKHSATKQSDFNLHQAVSALLSISSQDGLDASDSTPPGGEGDESLDEHDDEVVFTSKGVFRVGDVDVDPQYNRIGREGYTCGKCGKIFTSLSYLARHIKRVCPDMSCRKWKCNMCDKAFRHPFGLQQHIYTHTGERPHKCSQCPKAFYSSNDLRRHSRIHSGERPYHCKHCEKSFATTISLKTHTYIHTGEKPHKCPHCPKTFATSSKLGRHIVTHSEQRPFACDHCPKSFNRSGDLRRHNMHVHESRDKPFDVDDSSITQSNANNNTSTSKDIDQESGYKKSCDLSPELGHNLHHDAALKGGPTLNKSNLTGEILEESTESCSGDNG